jgi:hypothetical protein
VFKIVIPFLKTSQKSILVLTCELNVNKRLFDFILIFLNVKHLGLKLFIKKSYLSASLVDPIEAGDPEKDVGRWS